MQKIITTLIFVCLFFGLFTGQVFAGAKEDLFKATYEETEILTNELFLGINAALSGAELNRELLSAKAAKLMQNCDLLSKTALELKKTDAASEAAQMLAYMTRIKKIFDQDTDGHDYLTMLVARYYLHYNNTVMSNPICLVNMQKDHVDELRAALDAKDYEELGHLAEHLHLHSDQMYFASKIFGKKVWAKFAIQAKEKADEIFANAEKKDIEAVRAGVAEIEVPVSMLLKIVK